MRFWFYNKCWGGFHPSFFVYNKKDHCSSPQRNRGNYNKKSKLLYHRILRFKRGTDKKVRRKIRRNLLLYNDKTNKIYDYRIQTIKDVTYYH